MNSKPSKANKLSLKKQALINAYMENMGNVTKTCKDVGVDRTMFYQYKNEDEEFRNLIDNCHPRELRVDNAESALDKKIEEGDTASIIFTLKTLGKKRGYIEKHEVEHSGSITTFTQIADAIKGESGGDVEESA